MKTLYVSDLDGTLLRKNETVSEYTCGVIRMADECYAVENAHPDLKAVATGIIGANEEDGVARWLEENVL